VKQSRVMSALCRIIVRLLSAADCGIEIFIWRNERLETQVNAPTVPAATTPLLLIMRHVLADASRARSVNYEIIPAENRDET